MVKHELEEMLKPLVEDLGYELWGCEYLSQGKHSILRLYIDKESGIILEDCERVSKQVNAFLDVEEPISGHYNLEISSPGLPRPLFYKTQYKRYIGNEITLKLLKPLKGSRHLTGVLVATDDQHLTLKIDDQSMEIPFSQVIKANLTGE